MVSRKDLRQELELKLVPALERLDYSRSEWGADAFHQKHFPLGRFHRFRGNVIELVLIQFDKHGGPNFVLNFGVIPQSGVKALTGTVYTQEEALKISAFSVEGRLYSRPHSLKWFGQSWLKSMLGISEDPAKIVGRALSLLPEMESWFTSGTIGSHLKISPIQCFNIEWKTPWLPIQPDKNISRELRRELSSKHPLYGKKVRPIARRQDNDDVLFELVGEPPKVAVVHLTWTGKREPLPWPHSDVYSSLEDFAVNRMAADFAIS